MSSAELVLYHNNRIPLPNIPENKEVEIETDKRYKTIIAALETQIILGQAILSFDEFKKRLFMIAKINLINIHIFKNPINGFYICRLNRNDIIMVNIHDDEYKYIDGSKIAYNIQIKDHPSFHITTNHIWEKIVCSDKSKYISGSKKTQKIGIDEKGVKAARLVCKKKKNREKYLYEFAMLNQFKNTRGIVQVFDLVESRNKSDHWRLTFYEEYFDYGDMVSLIKKTPWTVTKKDISNAIEDIFCGLHSMHKTGVAHCDIKPDNVLFKRVFGKMVAAICDLDMAKAITNQPIKVEGTSFSLSPEKLFAYSYNKDVNPWTGNDEMPADVWACGITLHMLRTKYPLPWCISGDYQERIEYLFEFFSEFADNAYINIALEIPVGANKEKSFFFEPNPIEYPIDHLIWKMCQFDPKLRPTMEEVLVIWNAIPADKKN